MSATSDYVLVLDDVVFACAEKRLSMTIWRAPSSYFEIAAFAAPIPFELELGTSWADVEWFEGARYLVHRRPPPSTSRRDRLFQF